MNWASKFKNTKRRIKEEFLQALGAHERTVDTEFDGRVKKFMEYDQKLHKVQSSLHLYMECINALTAASAVVSESLTEFIESESLNENNEDEELANSFNVMLKGINNVNRDLIQNLKPSVQNTFNERVLKPTARQMQKLPEVHEKIEQRRQKMLDFDAYRSRYLREHQNDPNGQQTAKTAAKLQAAGNNVNSITTEIVLQLDQLEKNRKMVLAPMTASLLACQYQFFHRTSEMYADICAHSPITSSTLSILASYAEQARSRSSSSNSRDHRTNSSGSYQNLKPIQKYSPSNTQKKSINTIPNRPTPPSPKMIAKEIKSFKASRTPPKPPTPTNYNTNNTTAEPNVEILEAVFEFIPSEIDELSLKPGDRIVVLEKNSDGWWKGKVGQKQGLFPVNHTKKAG